MGNSLQLRRQAPLRRIVSEGANEYGVPTETLECGHVVHQKQYAFGRTNAYRRRCKKCAKGNPP